jgi:hypothetical protein
MTRMMWITSCAVLALAAPAAAKPQDKSSRPAAQQVQKDGGGGRQRAERPQRQMQAERPQRVRVERPQRQVRSERQQSRLRMERPQRHVRAERSQRQQRVERSPRVNRDVRREATQRRLEARPNRAIERQAGRVERDRRHVERRAARTIERRDTIRQRQAERQLSKAHGVDQRFVDRSARRLEQRDLSARTWQALADRREERPFRHLRYNDRTRDFTRAFVVGDRVDPRWYGDYVPLSYRTRYYDTPDYYYRYDDDAGYLYRIDRGDNLVSALVPLFGGGYGIGQPLPLYYRSSWVPYGYRTLYYDTPDYYYRYAGGSIYQVDAGSQLIIALVGLLSGQNFAIGQPLPLGYDAYNVPYAYRSRYYDTADSWYRYDDGYVYQVDPYSRIVEASYPIYDNGYYVGQPWPVAYPAYNVPNGYRDLYYDTPDWQYRFANGGIYRVDPESQMIQALVALATGQQFAVGQPMPVGYDVYNVPYAYRDRYYDSADAWYRYNDGFVYQVDPRTGLIERAINIYS